MKTEVVIKDQQRLRETLAEDLNELRRRNFERQLGVPYIKLLRETLNSELLQATSDHEELTKVLKEDHKYFMDNTFQKILATHK